MFLHFIHFTTDGVTITFGLESENIHKDQVIHLILHSSQTINLTER